ncbi:transposase, partial [Paracoccaceae bacterium]|nr:transposase [Paracoccaceae bacterium]
MVKTGTYDALLAEVCRQKENYGLKVKEASAAIIDATLIESAVHTHTHVEVPVEDWAEDENPDEPACVIFSSDHDARWIKKGCKSMLGHKVFARYDEEGFLDKIHTTPAHIGESAQFETMIQGSNAQRV